MNKLLTDLIENISNKNVNDNILKKHFFYWYKVSYIACHQKDFNKVYNSTEM